MATKPPRLVGRALVAARIAAETKGTDIAIRTLMRLGLGIDQLAHLPEDWRGDVPLDARPIQARAPRHRASKNLALPTRAWPPTSLAFAGAFREKRLTPMEVAERALASLERLAARRPTMNIVQSRLDELTQKQAQASTERWQKAMPLGPLDGVPFLVKDEYDVAGLPTTLGVRCESPLPKERHSMVVERLAQAGAVFICKTVLTEWGMSPIGSNSTAIMPHNPHHPGRAAGGSSTGSAAGVALGVAPMATAGDGGGSIRSPASLCGVFGIKPTFGRVSRTGDGFKGSVAHCGPIAASTIDLALFLDAVATTPDPEDALTLNAPPPPEGGFGALVGSGVQGLRIGIDDREWKDADSQVAQACQDALRALEKEGATLVSVDIPMAQHAAKIGYCTIGPESLAAHRKPWIEQRSALGDDLRLSFAVLSGFTALEQIDAQRLRVGLRRQTAQALCDVDVIAMPTTAITAPPYTEEDARLNFIDPVALDGLCRYCFLANLTGLPAATVPVGVDSQGLPIGLQILGDAWDEVTILALLAHLERIDVARVVRPQGAVDLFEADR